MLNRFIFGLMAARERYRSMGLEVMDMSQAEFAAYLRTDLDKWRTIAREDAGRARRFD